MKKGTKIELFKQSKILPTWSGGFLIQLQQSLVYVGICNIVMIAITMWYTAGYEITQKYLPSISIWHFLILLMSGWLTVMFIDYKFLHPARQRYMNKQVAKHKNPAMELLQKVDRDNEDIRKGIAKINKTLGIKENVGAKRKK